jgi:formiminoglutamase
LRENDNDTKEHALLQNSEAKYVIIGIPEDIGIRANFWRPGAASAWELQLKYCQHTA